MQTKPLIAIFDDQLRTIGFVSTSPEIYLEETDCTTEPDKHNLVNVIELLKTKPPRLIREGEADGKIVVDLQPVTAESKEYLSAVAEELKIAGFMAKIVPATIKSLLIHISIKFSIQQREKVLGEIVNLPSDIEPEAVAELQAILLELD